MNSSYRSAARAAITSGVIGIIGYGFLITAVTTRTEVALSLNNPTYLMFKTHDVLVILQFIFIIPVASALYRLSQLQPPAISKLTHRLGTGAAFCTALFLLLGIFLIISDGLYSVPQGIFGAWMVIVSQRMQKVLSNGLRWFGTIVGSGLIITGLFFPLYAIFVSSTVLKIPAVDPSDPANFPDHVTWINQHLHYLLDVGSVMGMLTLPFWTILIGRKLFRQKI
ncbi:MAG TPA: hypothetical protein VKT28_05665 [Puia sp.]|nr:hypothetical protein [Puia sp.]